MRVLVILAAATLAAAQMPGQFDLWQPNAAGTPKGFGGATLRLPAMDIADLLQQASFDDSLLKDFWFAQPHDISVSLADGDWSTVATPQGPGRLWTMNFAIPNALSLALFWDQFQLPEDSAMWISGKNQTLGPFTAKESTWDNLEFGHWHVPGNQLTVNVFLAPWATETPKFHIHKLTGAFRERFAGRCNINSECTKAQSCSGCSPTDRSCSIQCTFAEGDATKDQWGDHETWGNPVLGTVAMARSSGSRYCSGSFINNEAGLPMVLTAAHCRVGASDIIQAHFHAQDCTSTNDRDGTPVAFGNLKSLHRNTRIDNEYFLVGQDIPSDANIYLNGWSADRSYVAQSTVGIHHPSADNKKISNSNVAVTETSWGGGGGVQDHWRVEIWSEATTEPGSSGSPLFDAATQRIIGQLHGGSAACPAFNGWDSYGAVWASYDDGAKDFLGSTLFMDGEFLSSARARAQKA